MALFDAIEQGDLDAVRAAIASGATVDEIDDATGMAPLAMAAESGWFEISRLLLRIGADPNWGGATTPLEAAVLEGHQALVDLLIEHGADVNRAVEDGFTPLMTAISLRNLHMVHALLEAGANPTAINGEGDTPLTIAKKVRNRSISQAVERAAEGLYRPEEELSTKDRLFRAIRNRDLETIEGLLEGKIDLSVWNTMEQTPLAHAVAVGDAAIVEALLEAGADVDDGGSGTMRHNLSPLHGAVEGRHVDILELLLQHDAKVDGDGEEPPLFVAARRGCAACIRVLLEHGADAKSEDSEGTTALEAAASMGWKRAFELLASHHSKAEVAAARRLLRDIQEQRLLAVGETAELIEMIHHGQIDKVEQRLLQGGVDVNKADDQGNTLLMAAAARDEHGLIERLIALGARPDIRDKDGMTALIRTLYSSSSKRGETIAVLAKAGADINETCARGMTPLMHAVEGDLKAHPNGGGFAPGTMALIQLGADLEARDRGGNTVWMQIKRSALGASTLFSSQRRRLHQMLRFLENAGAARIESHLV